MKSYEEMAESVLEHRNRYVADRRRKMRKRVTMVSCFCFMAVLGTGVWYAGILNNGSDIPNRDMDDIKYQNTEVGVGKDINGAMGFEGYMAYDISELVSANPWREDAAITTLPVYKNPITYNEQLNASGADFDKMRELLIEIAGRMGVDTNEVTVTVDAPDEATTQEIAEKLQGVGDTVSDGYFDPSISLMIETEGMQIKIDQNMTVEIRFDPAVSLPSEYHFTDHASYEDISDVAEYLKTEYKDLIGFDDPQINIYGGDYNIYSEQGYDIEFFDANGGDTEQIINYNFNRVAFYCDYEGKLFLARVFRPDLSELVGDYPIITPEEAAELLSNGSYVTSVPYEMPGMEYVKKVELVYRTGIMEEYYMPYYRFYIELPEVERDGEMKTYGAYYVPAVSGEYISDIPTWNGSFN